MEIRKSGKIEYKIFKERDIQKLMNFFIELEKEIDHEYTALRLEIFFKDDTSNLGKGINVFDDTKEIKSLDFSVKNYTLKKKVSVSITDFLYIASYSVESEDEDWVNAKFTKIADIIEKAPNQNQWLSKENRQSNISNSLGAVLGIILLLTYIFHFPNVSLDLLQILVITFVAMTVGMSISHKIFYGYIFPLYPKIEFDTTLDHLNEKTKRKRNLKSIVALVAIPVLLNTFFALVF